MKFCTGGKPHPNAKNRLLFSQEWWVRETSIPKMPAKAVAAAKRAFDNAFCAGLTIHQAVEEALKNYEAYRYEYSEDKK